jgi:poly(3-hydroxybutyrate) depolymerase
MKTLCVFLLLASASAFATTCTPTGQLSHPQPIITPNGLTRYYDLYLPTNWANSTVLWVMLHPTTTQPGGVGESDFDQLPMECLADTNNIIVLWPIATLNPASTPNSSGQCTYIWEALDLAYIWQNNFTNCSSALQVVPDDSGFIAGLINTMKSPPYGITTVYVAGMSSGAFMAQRMGYEHPTLVNAVGAASGQIWAVQHGSAPPGLPLPPSSVSVLMLNGDADRTVDYCGTNETGWGVSDFPPSDASLNYWANNMSCQPASHALCNPDGSVNQQVTTVTCGSGSGKTTFSREVSNPHCWVTGTEARMLTFFAGGGWSAPLVVCPNITDFTPSSGKVGTSVTITGTSFTTASKVTFNGTNAMPIKVNSDSSITVAVPTGATTGLITITNTGGTFSSYTNFKVTPN